MNKLTSETPNKDKIVIVGQKEIEKQEKLVGIIKPQRGHTLFEIDLEKQTIELAQFVETDVISYSKSSKKYGVNKRPTSNGIGILENKFGAKKVVLDKLPEIHRKLIRKPNCIYISSLNRKNVIKKLVERGIVKLVKA